MQLHLRWAHYWMDCLGREDASECKRERGALDKQIYPFGKVGLMSQEPTHVGDEEAKHWHPMKAIKSGPEGLVLVDEKTVTTFIENFVKALATNEVDTQLRFYANWINYYELGQVTKDVVRKDLEHDIGKWPDRTYSITNAPKITADNDDVIAEFPMKFALTNSKGASSGTLQMTVRVKSQADAWQVVDIQKKVTRSSKR